MTLIPEFNQQVSKTREDEYLHTGIYMSPVGGQFDDQWAEVIQASNGRWYCYVNDAFKRVVPDEDWAIILPGTPPQNFVSYSAGRLRIPEGLRRVNAEELEALKAGRFLDKSIVQRPEL